MKIRSTVMFGVLMLGSTMARAGENKEIFDRAYSDNVQVGHFILGAVEGSTGVSLLSSIKKKAVVTPGSEFARTKLEELQKIIRSGDQAALRELVAQVRVSKTGGTVAQALKTLAVAGVDAGEIASVEKRLRSLAASSTKYPLSVKVMAVGGLYLVVDGGTRMLAAVSGKDPGFFPAAKGTLLVADEIKEIQEDAHDLSHE